MKLILSLSILFATYGVIAQFDNPSSNSVQFEQVDTAVPQPTGLELPATKVPGLSNKEYRFDANMDNNPLGKDDPKPIDITTDDGFLSTKTDMTPKAFQKDKPATDEYDRDQVLGQIDTGTSYVNVVYRDHQSVDGDRIRVYVNDDIVQSDISLDGTFRGFDLTLEPGENVIDFQALNQGDSGPNTAELHVYDDKGTLISKNEWNLLTGRKATIVVYKN
ncbi:hypothetical protein ULMS_18780 [Patiriisocius marinistellae]|uniref:Secreted protein n=1 Tax=Patiriisocius marinistellae TaxID=2494560 RepID=A0A5J4FW81_9FLAO|nr:hypothetical protein [Patiriisocius marinistellae]GEQ86370.1 hypothetical protein ULMS_18780 [Patiriisocius marinistellae]